jgi:exodeoxyribonuclease VIII
VAANTFALGVREHIPAADYHAVPALSSTFMKAMLARSPLHAWHQMHAGESNDAMNMGTAVHTAILTPDMYEAEVAVAPKCDKRTTAGKAEFRAFEVLHGHKLILDSDQGKAVDGMVEAVQMSNACRAMLEMATQRELSVFAEDPHTGTQLKARLDGYDPATGWVIDLKTCRDASYPGFRSALWNLGYGLQAAFYRRVARIAGLNVSGFAFLCVENTAPHGVAVYAMDDSDMDYFEADMRRLIADYKVCRETGEWPGYPDRIERIGLANWARRQLEEGLAR